MSTESYTSSILTWIFKLRQAIDVPKHRPQKQTLHPVENFNYVYIKVNCVNFESCLVGFLNKTFFTCVIFPQRQLSSQILYRHTVSKVI